MRFGAGFSCFNIALLVAFSFSNLVEVAEAKTRKPRQQSGSEYEAPIHYTQAATEVSTETQRSATRLGAGFSTIGNSITGIFEFDRLNMLQGFFAIPQTSPFNIGGKVFFKHSLVQGPSSGFHVGGGFGLASINTGTLAGANLGLDFTLVGGFHFELPGLSHVMIHLDGGPSFSLLTTSPSTQTNFQVSAVSPALGASVLYMF